jgi:hypothetical protein
MNGRHGGVQRYFLGLALVLMVQSVRSEPSPFAAINGFEPHFIPPSGSIYIKNIKTDFHAVGDGVTDDTKAFKDAIEADNPRTIYIPAGTYLIREPLRYGEQGNNKKRVLLIGESRATTIIKLADGAAGFDKVATPKVFIHTRRSRQDGENNMHMYLYHLTIEIGINNPGAIALNFHTNNTGALRDIEVRASDPVNHRPFRGIAFNDYWFGPGSGRYLSVKGFRQGVFVYNAQNHTTLEHVHIEQCDTGLTVGSDVVSARKIHTKECNVAVVNKGFLTMVESSFDGTNGDIALINSGRLVVRDMKTSGYTTALKNGQNTIAGPVVRSFLSSGISSNWAPQAGCDSLLGLPVAESPEYQYPSSAQGWTLIPASLNDISAELQGAIDAGKEFIMLDDGTIAKTIILRNKVKKIMGAGVRSINYDAGTAPVFRLEAGEPPAVIVELLYEGGGNTNEIVFEQASPRTLVLRHGSGTYRTAASGSGGSVFLESFGASPLVFTKVNAWGRDINTEMGGPNAINIVNDNGQLWLLGQKTEDWSTKLKTVNGGVTELLGGTYRQNWDDKDFTREGMTLESAPPLFEIVNAHAAFSFASWGPRNYRVLVRETRGEETRDLIHKDYGGQADGTQNLYVGYTRNATAQTRFGARYRAPSEGGIKVCQVHSGAHPQLAITLESSHESSELSLYALSGRVVAHHALAPSTAVQMVPLGGLSAGTYLAVLRQGGKQIGLQRVLIAAAAEAKK